MATMPALKCASTCEMPSAANTPQNHDPHKMPEASHSAGRRPAFMAMPMMAMLLGPGLPAPIR